MVTPRVDPLPNEGALGVQIGVATRRRERGVLLAGVRQPANTAHLRDLGHAYILEGRPIGDAGFMACRHRSDDGEFVRYGLCTDSLQPIHRGHRTLRWA